MTALERYWTLKKQGMCTRCGKRVARPNRGTCDVCKLELREKHKAVYETRKKLGRCVWCQKKAMPGYIFCEKCREVNNRRNHERYDALYRSEKKEGGDI